MNWLELQRFAYTPFGTFGVLTVWAARQTPEGPNAKFAQLGSCYTLERPWADNAPNVSCVPVGKYPLFLQYSPKFKRELWELTGVPGRSECKFHPANLATELEGCIAPGLRLGAEHEVWAIRASATALQQIHELLAEQKASYVVIGNMPEQGRLDAGPS